LRSPAMRCRRAARGRRQQRRDAIARRAVAQAARSRLLARHPRGGRPLGAMVEVPCASHPAPAFGCVGSVWRPRLPGRPVDRVLARPSRDSTERPADHDQLIWRRPARGRAERISGLSALSSVRALDDLMHPARWTTTANTPEWSCRPALAVGRVEQRRRPVVMPVLRALDTGPRRRRAPLAAS